VHAPIVTELLQVFSKLKVKLLAFLYCTAEILLTVKGKKLETPEEKRMRLDRGTELVEEHRLLNTEG
jgi:hypothetical protein